MRQIQDFENFLLHEVFTFPLSKIENGLKYLGFNLKPCRYLIKDWDWLITKVEKRVKNWSFRWLSKGGKLILIKSGLESIPVYWMQFWIPMTVIGKIRKICFKFLWAGKDASGLPWTSGKSLAIPNFLGGWGLKILVLFAKDLAVKSTWNIIHGNGLWVQIAIQKYIHPLSLIDWIRSSIKQKRRIYTCWKAVLWSFDLIGNSLVWKVGNEAEVRIGLDPWVGYLWRHILPAQLIERIPPFWFLFFEGYWLFWFEFIPGERLVIC